MVRVLRDLVEPMSRARTEKGILRRAVVELRENLLLDGPDNAANAWYGAVVHDERFDVQKGDRIAAEAAESALYSMPFWERP